MPATLRLELDEYRATSLRTGLSLALYEVTVKVGNDLFAFVPTDERRALVLGTLGRARQQFPDVDLYGFHVMSNHLHLLVGAESLEAKAAFLAWFLRELARRTNQQLGWTGPLLVRNHCIQIMSDAHALQRLKYVMGQATAQYLVRHPADDFFPCSTPALLHGGPIPATFCYAGGDPIDCRIHLDRLPCLADLSPRAHRDLMWQLADELAIEARPRRKKAGRRIPQPDAIKRLPPTTRPRTRDRSPQPPVHGDAEHHALWHEAHAAARAAYTRATRAFQAWHRDPTQPLLPWPPHTLPPAFARPRVRAGPAG